MANKQKIHTKLIAGLSLFVMGIGALVLYGWYAGNTALVQISPHFAPMQFNTALCFLMIGIALFCLVLGKNKFSVLFASASLLISTLTLIEYVFYVNIGIDELFMQHYVFTNTSHPGRMAPNTAFCFFLSSIYFIISICTQHYQSKYLRIVEGYLAFSVLLLSSVALLGYITGMSYIYGWGGLTRMALHTGFAFFVWSIGALLIVWPTLKGQWKRKTVYAPFIVFFVVLIGAVIIWSTLVDKENDDLDLFTETTEAKIVNEFENLFAIKIRAIERKAKRWHAREMGNELWEEDINAYLEDFLSMKDLYWTEKKYGEEETTIFTKENGEYEILIYVPIFEKNEFKGGVLSIIDAESFIDVVLKDETENFYFWIKSDGEYIYKSAEEIPRISVTHERNQIIKLGSIEWEINVWPTERTIEISYSWANGAVLVIGILMSVCLALMSGMMQILRELAEKNRLILNSAGEGICGVDKKGHITFLNPAAEKMLGWLEGEVLGKSEHEIFHYTDNDMNVIEKRECEIIKTLKDKQEHRSDTEMFVRKDGRPFDVEYISRPILDDDESLKGAVVTFKDITERKTLEQNIIKKSNDLTHANKELQSFSYSVSHDLRAPLRHITGFIELLQKNTTLQIDETGQRHFEYIHQAASKMGDLIEDLLAFSRAGRAELVKVSTDLNEVAQESKERVMGDVSGRDINWDIADLPTVQCDPKFLEMVFDNLFINALKFTQTRAHTSIKVTCEESKDKYTICVEDNGVGFDQQYVDKIFEVFQRLHSDTVYEGTGIGLANVKKTILRHNGEVWAEGVLDKGAKVCFTLPKN